jgi:glycogen operon protein
MQDDAWRDENTRCFGMLMDGRAQVTGIRQRGNEATLLLVLNAHHDIVQFTLPECPGGERWARLLDTNTPDSEPIVFNTGDQYEVTGRSSLLFALQASDSSL